MKHRFAVPPVNVRPGLPSERIPHQRDGNAENYIRLPDIFDRETVQNLAALHRGGIDPIVCGGAAAALALGRENLMRPSSDIDVMISPDQYKRASIILGGRQYHLKPLFGLDQAVEAPEVSFIEKGKLQITAGSDCTPGNFSLTNLVKDKSTMLNIASPEDKEDRIIHCQLHIVPPEEVMLSKLCWGRDKDWHDYGLLKAKVGSNFDYPFLAERIKETGTEAHVRARYKRGGLDKEVLANHGILL